MNSNQKGKKGERELAAILKSYGPVKCRLSCIGRIEKSGWLLCHWMIG